MSRVFDRAAVVTIAIRQMIATLPKKDLRDAVEDYLRDEFADHEGQVVSDVSSNREGQ
jgi:DNA-binding protein Fis